MSAACLRILGMEMERAAPRTEGICFFGSHTPQFPLRVNFSAFFDKLRSNAISDFGMRNAE